MPETPGGERNWDYPLHLDPRLDTLRTLPFLNLDWEADEFMQYIADLKRNEDGGLQIMYGGSARPEPETLREEALGYTGARPVRIGNGAFDQRQNDVYGAALDSGALADPQPTPAAAAGSIPGRVRNRRLARQPDQGSGKPAANPATTSPPS